MKPTMSLARRDRKNEPWPQSCMMMKVRTRKPAATTQAASASG